MPTATAEKPGVVSRLANSVSAALAAIASTKATAEQQAAATRDELSREYLQLIARSDNAKAGDAERLTAILPELGIDPDHAQADTRLIATVRQLSELVEDEVSITATHSAAVAAKTEMVKRHRDELREADVAVNRASHEAQQMHAAKRELTRIAGERPELFNGILELPSNVPRPQSPEPPKPVRKCPEVTINVGTHVEPRYVEPIVGPDGNYVRGPGGKYVLPDGSFA